MANGFTQGRWYLQEYSDAYTNIIRCDNGKGMETIYIADLHGTGCNNRENAKLIAAAPDLLEALQLWQAANALGDNQLLTDARTKRDLAIKKATE